MAKKAIPLDFLPYKISESIKKYIENLDRSIQLLEISRRHSKNSFKRIYAIKFRKTTLDAMQIMLKS